MEKDTSTIEKYCSSKSCNTTSSQTTTTNNTQISSRMRYAQYIKNFSELVMVMVKYVLLIKIY